jgi:cytidine deaminase
MKNDLRAVALAARDQAYAPYSGFRVGAALLTASGRIYAGCNVENVSLGLTMCAERVCVGRAVADGDTEFEQITIVSESQTPIVPCGACRQVLAEFGSNLIITSWTVSGEIEQFSLAQLLPAPRQGILEVPRGT